MPSTIHNAFMRTGKRVSKACDYCRLKKSKVSTNNCIERCATTNLQNSAMVLSRASVARATTKYVALQSAKGHMARRILKG